jgi:hypothetical protein
MSPESATEAKLLLVRTLGALTTNIIHVTILLNAKHLHQSPTSSMKRGEKGHLLKVDTSDGVSTTSGWMDLQSLHRVSYMFLVMLRSYKTEDTIQSEKARS